MDQTSDYHSLRMDQISSFAGHHESLGYPHHQGWPTKLDQAATMHSMMSLCRVDFPPFKMQTALPNQMYGHASFEGILELRKEKSRDAARSRRGKENYEYYELAKMLPLPQAITSQLDKASIIRLTISFLKLKDFSCHGDPPWRHETCTPVNKAVNKGGHNRGRRSSIPTIPIDMFETHHGTHILQSLDGFAFALSNDGRFLYISETVSIYLGLSQVEMTGSSLFDYVHIQDHQELAEQLGLNNPGTPHSTSTSTSATLTSTNTDQDQDSASSSRAVTPTVPERTSIMTPSMSQGFERCFCIRMKSTLTKRGVHVKCSGYRVVQFLANMRSQFTFSLARKHPPPIMGLVGLAIALPPPTLTELLIDNDMFVSRLSPELNLIYVEPKIAEMMDLCSEDLTGENLYNHCHAEDLQKLRKAHIDLLSKGQVLTDYYRLMNKHGGFVWIQTCATIAYNSKNQDEQNIIGINYVLSGVEYPGCVMDMNQLSTLPNHQHDHSDHSESEHGSERNHPHGGHHTPSPSQDYGQPSSNARCFMRGHKRKHSAGQDDCSRTVTQLLEFGSMSSSPPQPQPQNGFQMIYNQEGSDIDTNMNSLYSDDGTLLGDDKHLKHDFKNSRRKMDKPRKRKKDLEDLENKSTNLGIVSHCSSSNGKSDLIHRNSSVPENLVDLQSEIASLEDTVSQQTARPNSVHSLPTSPNTASNEIVAQQTTATTKTLTNTSTPIPEDLRVSSPHAADSPTGTSTVNTSSASLTYINSGTADKAWLPPPTSTVSSSPPNYTTEVSAVGNGNSSSSSVRDLEEVMNKHLPITPAEAEHLRNEYTHSLLGLQKHHKSAIQWVGPAVATTNDLTATNLLRSLYANRETVIRSNVYNPRPQYYSEVQSSLLTPPGATTDPYKDTFTVPKTTPPTTYTNLHYTPPNSLSVSMTTGMTDSYSMTPPSSVSPQEKYSSSFGDHQVTPPSHYENVEGGVSMPIKPQAYPLPAHNNSHLTGYDRAASQYAATAAYYSPAYAYTSHRDPTKNAMW